MERVSDTWYFGVFTVITRDSINILAADIIFLDLKYEVDKSMKKRHRRHLRMAILGGPLYFGDLEVAKKSRSD
ncbi:MAG: hypothetical protein JSV56_11100 [Methanomassiliicoccales archaeon]|nr:MAG: hypothetical protein JSV56_11100 [Methanomassiliicoccales archaeon]